MGGLSSFIRPAFLSAFQLGLREPELGPVGPLAADLTLGSLIPNVDAFVLVADRMHQAAEKLDAESAERGTSIPRVSLIHRLRRFGRRMGHEGLARCKSGIGGGLPQTVGTAPDDSRMRWVLKRTWRDGNVTSVSFHQESDDFRIRKEVTIRQNRRAAYLRIVYGVPGLEVSHAATAGIASDFQELSFRLHRDAVQKIVLEDPSAAVSIVFRAYQFMAAPSVFVSELSSGGDLPLHRVDWNETGLFARFLRTPGGERFPKEVVTLARNVEREVDSRIRQKIRAL